MADKVTQFVCPACGSSLKFDATNQNIKCPYCDSEFSIEDIKAMNEEKNRDFKDETSWDTTDSMKEFSTAEQAGMVSYLCDACGGEIICGENTSSTSCPYCGNNVLLRKNLTGALKPKYIIPFKKTEKDAKDALKNYMKKKILLPRLFKSENKINEIKPLYVPYWLYDADVNARIHYRCSNTHRYTRGDYEYTETSYYSVIREGGIAYEHLPVDASKSIDNKLTEAIEPFSFNETKEFETAYLAGYMSDKYDQTAEECSGRATQRIKEGTEIAFRKTVTGYQEVRTETCNIKLYNTKVDYAYFPIYILGTKWKDNTYTFAMNGETGKLKGNLPMSPLKFVLWLIGQFVVYGGLIGLLMYFIFQDSEYSPFAGLAIGLVIGLIVALIVTFIFKSQLKGAKYQKGSAQYYKPGSMNLVIATDRFLYKKSTRRRINNIKN